MPQILGANPSMRRAWLEHNTGHSLDAVADTAFAPEQVRGNIENLVGADARAAGDRRADPRQRTSTPRAVLRPVRDDRGNARHDLPVRHAGDHRGGRRQRLRPGRRARHHSLLRARDLRDALSLAQWLHDHLPELKDLAAETTAHGRLVDVHTHVFGRRVFARFVLSTGDAMGMNMVNLAVDRICRHVLETIGVRAATTCAATTRATRSRPRSTSSGRMARRSRST